MLPGLRASLARAAGLTVTLTGPEMSTVERFESLLPLLTCQPRLADCLIPAE